MYAIRIHEHGDASNLSYPLKEASAAQSYMEERGTKGKVLILP